MTTVNNEKDLTEVQWLREQVRRARDSEASAKYCYNEEKNWRKVAEKDVGRLELHNVLHFVVHFAGFVGLLFLLSESKVF